MATIDPTTHEGRAHIRASSQPQKEDTLMKALTADPDRIHLPEVDICVRALNTEGRMGNADIAHLNRDSLDEWPRSREDIDFPISVAKTLLGHPRGGEAGHL